MADPVEVMARAIDPDKFTFWQSSYDYEMGQSGDAAEATKFADWCHNLETVRQQAQAALSALDAAGFVVVPKEPTQAMLRAFQNMTDYNGSCLVIPGYRAMLSAAQVKP